MNLSDFARHKKSFCMQMEDDRSEATLLLANNALNQLGSYLTPQSRTDALTLVELGVELAEFINCGAGTRRERDEAALALERILKTLVRYEHNSIL